MYHVAQHGFISMTLKIDCATKIIGEIFSFHDNGLKNQEVAVDINPF